MPRSRSKLSKNMAGEALGPGLSETIEQSNVLVVGAGGIGCELLKNLALTGFQNVSVIDLDTIDVSNLNRQFLFQRKHVGKSKSKIAKERIQEMKPNINITAYHDNIMSGDYNADFFRQFTLVMNALDNKAARNHVNRMCLAADVPLIESGSAGYLGQVTVIKKGFSECYECQPKPAQKTYPGCTIRNTPSEPIHCIVWAKHLFNQLFGEADADAEVSPDTEDPELNDGQAQETNEENTELKRRSTRKWVEEVNYDAEKLFDKFFMSDIHYLLSMDKLWKKRRPPVPLSWQNAMNLGDKNKNFNEVADIKKIWSISDCTSVFSKSVDQLWKRLKQSEDFLVWDKDDDISMNFVAAAANIRSHVFGIQLKSRFDIKSMAGNIIPAIATTNAVISGLIVMEALKLLSGNIHNCKTVYLNKQPKVKKRLLATSDLIPPNPECYVCAPKPEVTVHLNLDKVTVKTFEDKILKEKFGMVAPDVEIDDGKGTILISSEEGETEENNNKVLSTFKIKHGSRLKADDFLQNYELIVCLRHRESKNPEELFVVEGDIMLPRNASTTSFKENSNLEAPEKPKTDSPVDMETGSSSTMKRKRQLDTEDGISEKSAKDEDDVIVL